MNEYRKRLALPAWALTASSLLIVTASTNALGQPQPFRSVDADASGPLLDYDLAGLTAAEDLAMGGHDDFVRRIRAARPFFSADRGRALDCLTAAVYHEARSEGESGQRAVAQVVLNRVRHPAFPNSVCGVVYQGSWRRTGCQFTFTCDGSLRRRPVAWAWAEARRIAEEALTGQVYAPVGHATHYHTDQVRPYWAPTLTRITSVGAHIFYRWRGAAGEPQSFTQFAAAEIPAAPAAPAPAARIRPRVESPPVVKVHVGDRPTTHVRLAVARTAQDRPTTSENAQPAPTAGFSISGLESRIGPAS